MSKGRTVFSRPRTKVYETNYNIGESLYKPALDGLDRKYSTGRRFGDFGGPSANGDIFSMRSAPLPPMEMPSARTSLRNVEDDFFGDTATRRRPNSALLGEFDAIFDDRMRNGMSMERTPMMERSSMMDRASMMERSSMMDRAPMMERNSMMERTSMRGGRTLEDEIEDDITASMKKLRALKASRSQMDEFDEMESNFRRDMGGRSKLDFGEKVMDSVGLTRRERTALEEEGATTGRRRFLKMSSEPTDGEELTKWTALRPRRRQFGMDEEEESVTQTAAATRALKSRARLDDLESEMQQLSERSAAREKRVRDLKALVQENEANAMDNLQTTVRVKSSIQSEKKSVAF